MVNLKKLTFAPFFLLSFAFLCYQLPPFLGSLDSFFSFSLGALFKPAILAAIALLASFFFILFATLAEDWLVVGIVILLAGIIPIIFLPSPLNLYLGVGTVLSLVITFAILLNKLKAYLTFQPNILLTPSIKNFATLMALVIAILYFLSAGQIVQEKGVKIFDPLIDSTNSLFNPLPDSQTTTPEQSKAKIQAEIDKLKNNPELIKLYGIDPKTLSDPGQVNAVINRVQEKIGVNSSQADLIKGLAHSMIQPYLGFVAPILAILTFFAITSSVSLLSLLLPVLLWATFSLLKSTGFIKFETEMREVKKLVV